MSSGSQHHYSIEGVEFDLVYNGDTHTLTITSENISEVLSSTSNVQAKLLELGIYARVDSIERLTTDTVNVFLRPASGVDIRGPDEEGKPVLLDRLVSSPRNVDSIQKRRRTYSYVVSIDSVLLDESPLTRGEPISISFHAIRDDIGITLTKGESDRTRTISENSSPKITLPPSVASSLDLDGHTIEWIVTESGLTGRTSAPYPHVDAITNGEHTTISRVSQSVDEDGTRKQEHAVAYLLQPHVRTLGWEKGYCLDIRLVQGDRALGVALTTNVRSKFANISTDGVVEPDAPCTRTLYEGSPSQLYFNFPMDMAYTFNLLGNRVRWEARGNMLVGEFPS